MSFLQTAVSVALGADVKIRRLIRYWAITAVLYLLCAGLLWFEVEEGGAGHRQAIWLSAIILGGLALFYVLIRASARWRLTPSQLAFPQGVHAIVCIVAAYATVAPLRGAILTLLLVVLVFCAFALESKRSHQISAFAILLLGATMWWRMHADPAAYPPRLEGAHFVLATSMIVAVVFLTSQFNWMRNRLKSQKAELERIAMRDDLTGLPNRRHMKDVLAEQEKRHRKSANMLCLALLDIDHFKSINDTYGHAAGDDILRSFAQQVKGLLRLDDVLARWGGEEFLMVLPNTDEQDAMLVLERVRQQLGAIPVAGFGTELRVTFSSGVALMALNETIVDTIRRADKAMFRAKSLGRNRVCLYDPDMEAGAVARTQMKADLAHAIATGQLELHYQPQVRSDGQLTGAEALVRWRHPDRGLVFPGDFIPLAEESDLIIALGEWVLAAACAQLAAWAGHEATAGLSLSVNVSARQLRHPDFVPHTLAMLGATGIDPGKLKLELTESVLVDDVDAAIDTMNRLRQTGVRFSLDDFGTGYSSLSYLKQLPLSQIKIDRAFVSDIVAGDKDGMIARAIISLSHSLGCNVLAEGVETELQKDFLARNGCHDFQGYWFGKPMPIEVFERMFYGAPSPA